jgi:UDP-N-acetylglucosamine 2-epimerase
MEPRPPAPKAPFRWLRALLAVVVAGFVALGALRALLENAPAREVLAARAAQAYGEGDAAQRIVEALTDCRKDAHDER